MNHRVTTVILIYMHKNVYDAQLSFSFSTPSPSPCFPLNFGRLSHLYGQVTLLIAIFFIFHKMAASDLSEHIRDLPTPCFLLNLKRIKHNADLMIQRCQAFGIKLRPHMKTAKTVYVHVCKSNKEIAVIHY